MWNSNNLDAYSMRKNTEKPNRTRLIGKPKDFCLVYFSSSRKGWGKSWTNIQLMRLVRFFTRSPLAHCCIGYDHAVFDYTAEGPVYRGIDMMMQNINLEAVVKVPISRPIDLDYWQEIKNKPLPRLKVFWRWLRRGKAKPVIDCLGSTCVSLILGGVDVPEGFYTPKQLFDWLTIEKGYEYVSNSEHFGYPFWNTLRHWTVS